MKKVPAVVALLALLMTPVAQAADMGEVNVPVLNVRAEASTSSELLGKLAEGTNVQVDAKKNDWCQVMFKSKKAFVACMYLNFETKKAEVTAPVTQPTTTTPAVTQPALKFPLTRVVTVSSLNVRSTATIAADNIMGKLAMGTRLEVMEKSQDNWCRIEFTGKVAWVSCAYLAKAEYLPVTTTPTVTSPTTTSTGTTMSTTQPMVDTTVSAKAGCEWLLKDFTALTMQVEQCNGKQTFNYGVRGNGVYKFTTSIDTPTGAPVLELYAKSDDEPVMDAVMSLVSSTIPADEQGKCVVRKMSGNFSDQSKEMYALAPTADYQKVVDGRLANEPNFMACGAYGSIGGRQYFEYHPGESKTIFAFVRTDGMFNTDTIVIR